MASIKTRFCPSPTGLIHMGNARTALFNALFAARSRGTFLLRIEDTDVERSKAEFIDYTKEDLRWLNLDWQEGPDVGGAAEPYFQSQRQDIYDQYYATLEKQGKAYSCFCSERELEVMRKIQRSSGKPPRYAGTCRHLTKEQCQAKLNEGLKPTLRFLVPDDETTVFEDLVHGQQSFAGSDIGDFIIRRGNGTSPFMFCNAVDDALMGVTHVLRGDDHLTNTPRQLMILQALGLPTPQYGHTSLILGPDGSPFSKRHGSRNLQELRSAGYLPEALLNYMARLGHYYENPEYMTWEQLAEQFDLSNLSRSPAHFDMNQLHHWQREAITRVEDNALWEWMSDVCHETIPSDKCKDFVKSIRPNILFREDAEFWAQTLFNDTLIYTDDAKSMIKETGEAFFQTALDAVNEMGVDNKAVCNVIKDKTGAKGKGLFQPLRLALTGVLFGPEMVHIFELIGVDGLKARLQTAITMAK